MKQLAEFVPIALFFIVYQLKGEEIVIGGWSHTFDGIFSATAVLIIATTAQVVITFAITRELEKRLIWLLLAVAVFGGATLIFRNQMFIQWKPTVLNWLFAVVFLFSMFIGDRPIIQRMMGEQIKLPENVWKTLNLSWVAFFIISGTANLYVAFYYDIQADAGVRMDTWVNFKLFGLMGLWHVYLKEFPLLLRWSIK